MAKCPICNSKKGKRACPISNQPICTICCGTTRKPETCSECGYYEKPRRKYNEVPSFSVSEMGGDMDLQSYSNGVEGAICVYDTKIGGNLKDGEAIRIIELLIDRYYFKDKEIDTDDQRIADGFAHVQAAIKEDFEGASEEVDELIVKILGVVWFVANRRMKTGRTGREYMNVIHQYVGLRVGPGTRLVQVPK